MDASDIFRLLKEIEFRSRHSAAGLPQQDEEREFWQGVVFSIGHERFVAGLGAIAEILNYPTSVTPVPGAKLWMRGIANIRGVLLPIIDLNAFLEAGLTAISRRSRVLVFRHGTHEFGLLVGELVSMRHFDQLIRTDKREGKGQAFRYVTFGFDQEDSYWPVFSVEKLADSLEFQSAAI